MSVFNQKKQLEIKSWRQALRHVRHEDHVLVSVIAVSGSVPRGVGTKMLVTRQAAYDTVGGGQLELKIIEQARRMLIEQSPATQITHFPLAAAADQCCGGSVTILFEHYAAVAPVCVFGAGHVGRAVCDMLGALDVEYSLLDTREQIEGLDVQTKQDYVRFADPEEVLKGMPLGAHVLIMTHDHGLDYQLVSTCLRAGFVSIGLIGSDTKWQRFQARLLRDGFTHADLARVRSPIGVEGISRKDPPAVAVSIVAQLLQLQSVTGKADATLSWRQIKSTLVADNETN